MSSDWSQPTFIGTVGERESQARCGVGLSGGFWPFSAMLSRNRVS
jgi:hypothetical protein